MGLTNHVNPNDSKDPLREDNGGQIIQKMTRGGVDHSFQCTLNLDVVTEAFLYLANNSSTH